MTMVVVFEELWCIAFIPNTFAVGFMLDSAWNVADALTGFDFEPLPLDKQELQVDNPV